MITILIMNLLDTLSGVDAPAEPTRRNKRRFTRVAALAAMLLVLAIAIAPWALPIPYR